MGPLIAFCHRPRMRFVVLRFDVAVLLNMFRSDFTILAEQSFYRHDFRLSFAVRW